MSFVQDNLDRFDKIHSDYNNLANSVGNLINPSKDTKDNDVKNYVINEAKWKSANDFCQDNGMEFKILTEDHLNPKYK